MLYLYLDESGGRDRTIHSGSTGPDVRRLEAGTNNLGYAHYGLTPEEIATVEGKWRYKQING